MPTYIYYFRFILRIISVLIYLENLKMPKLKKKSRDQVRKQNKQKIKLKRKSKLINNDCLSIDIQKNELYDENIKCVIRDEISTSFNEGESKCYNLNKCAENIV